MKKLLLSLLILATPALLAQNPTPNVGLQLPPTGSANWYAPLNYNFTKLDLLLSGKLPLPGLVVSGLPATFPVGSLFGGKLPCLQDGTDCPGGGGVPWPTFTGLAAYGGADAWVTPTYSMVTSLWTSCTSGWLAWNGACTTPSGAGTVTDFSAGNLAPLFTSSVADASTTPALSFSISAAAQNSVLAGPPSGGAGAYSFQTAPTFSAANLTDFPTLNQDTTGVAANVTGIVAVANGGTGTASPSLVEGANVTITGTWPNQTIAASGSGGMVYPPAGVPLSTGSAWGTSYAAPSSALVGVSDTQSLTNKTLDGVTPATMAFVDPTSSVQTQLNAKLSVTTASATYAPLTGTGASGTWPIDISGSSANVTATANATLTTLSSLSLPYAQLSGSPAIPGSSNWPNAGSCTSGEYVNELADGSAPSCAVVQYSQLGGSVPTWNQNTTGTSANLSGTPALPNGTTATTQTTGDNTTKIATDAFVLANASGGSGIPATPANALVKINGSNGAASSITDNGTTVSTTEPLSANGITSNAVAGTAGIVAVSSGATEPALPSDQFGWLGMSSPSESVFFQPPSTAPAANQILVTGTPASVTNGVIVPLTYENVPGGGSPSAPAYSVQIANPGVTGFTSDSNILINTTTHALEVGAASSGKNLFSMTNLSTIPASWTFDVTSPATTANSIITGNPISPSSISPSATVYTAPELCAIGGTWPSCTPCTTAATINPALGNRQMLPLTAGDTCALTFTQPTAASVSLTLVIMQSSAGSYNGLISTSAVYWPGGITPTITAASGAVDILSCYLNGTYTRCLASQNFAL